jgi:shikimate kinase
MNLRLKRHPGIYLVGFMGCGKTTIGPLLAEGLGWTFADVDDDIVKREQCSIADIFDQRGEEEFRRIENEVLAERVKQIRGSRPLVVAMGGGAFVQQQNLELVGAHGISIWLDCPFGTIQKRLAGVEDRPLMRNPVKFRKLYEDRRTAYAKADFRIASGDDDPAIAVRAILEIPGLF